MWTALVVASFRRRRGAAGCSRDRADRALLTRMTLNASNPRHLARRRSPRKVAKFPRPSAKASNMPPPHPRHHHARNAPKMQPGPTRPARQLGLAAGRPLSAGRLTCRWPSASYPSSVLMNAIPRPWRGLSRLVITVAKRLTACSNPLVLLLGPRQISGCDRRFYRITRGAARRLRPLAYGTNDTDCARR